MTMRILPALLVTVFVGSGVVAQDQSDRWREQVSRRLQVLQNVLEEQGYQLVVRYSRDRDQLDQGDTRAYPLNLSTYTRYRIVAVGDDDCRNMDLTLHNSRGQIIATDTRVNALPVLDFRSERGRFFELRVDMKECLNSPCRLGVGVYSRR